MTEFLMDMGCIFCGFIAAGTMFLVITVYNNCVDIEKLKRQHTSLAVRYHDLSFKIKNQETNPEEDD